MWKGPQGEGDDSRGEKLRGRVYNFSHIIFLFTSFLKRALIHPSVSLIPLTNWHVSILFLLSRNSLAWSWRYTPDHSSPSTSPSLSPQPLWERQTSTSKRPLWDRNPNPVPSMPQLGVTLHKLMKHLDFVSLSLIISVNEN